MPKVTTHELQPRKVGKIGILSKQLHAVLSCTVKGRTSENTQAECVWYGQALWND